MPAPPARVKEPFYYDEKKIAAVIRKLGKARAPGCSGWTYELLQAAMINETCKAGICLLINLIANGQLSSACAEMLLATRDVPIAKRSAGVRPLGIGECFYRVAAKLVCGRIADKYGKVCENLQFAVGVAGGAQTALHLMQSAIDDKSAKRCLLMFDADDAFQNVHSQSVLSQAFQHDELEPAWRMWHWSLSRDAPVFVTTREGVVGQWFRRTGVPQGCPLGMAGFALGFQPVVKAVHTVAATDKGRAFAFADNLNAIVTPARVQSVVEAAESEGDKHGVRFNLTKATLLWPHEEPLDPAVRAYAESRGIRIAYKATELLGAAIGSDEAELTKICMNKNANLRELFAKLESADDLTCQEAFALIHSSNMVHVLRSCTPAVTRSAAIEFDSLRENAFQKLANLHQLSDKQRDQLRARFRHGGFGLASAEQTGRLRLHRRARPRCAAAQALQLHRLGISDQRDQRRAHLCSKNS